MVVVEKSADQLLCRVERATNCGAGCSGCSRSNELMALPADLIGGKVNSVGDSVQFEASGLMLLALSSLVYLSPVLLMLLFSVCCSLIYPASEAMVALSAAVGLGVGLGAIYLIGGGMLRSQLGNHLAVKHSHSGLRQGL